MNELATTSSEV